MAEAGIPRMRTIAQCAEHLKGLDPETKITEWRIRKMVAEGVVPHTDCGRTKLVNLDRLLECLAAGGTGDRRQEEGNVRPVKVSGIRRMVI